MKDLISNKTYENPTLSDKNPKVKIIISEYISYKNTAVIAIVNDPNSEYDQNEWGSISTNLTPLEKNMFAVDINNNCNAEEWLVKNNIATNTGAVIPSGYVTYPIYKLNDEFIKDCEKIENQE